MTEFVTFFINSKNKKGILLIVLSGLLSTGNIVSAQDTIIKRLTLNEVIDLAKDQSLQAIMAKHRFRGSYWEYRSHLAKYLPHLSLQTTFPGFNRSLSSYQTQEGNYIFVNNFVNNTTLDLNITQNIGLTGGSIFMRSELQRVDQLGHMDTFSYLSTPVSIGFTQPINGYNPLRWEKKIEPLKYEEAKKTYIDDMESVAIRAVNDFFDLALAQSNVEIANINFQNADTLYKIAQGRYNLGTIAEDELLQMELSHLNAGTDVNRANVNLEVAKFQLRSFLGFNNQVDIELLIPKKIPNVEVEVDKALDLAKNNNPELIRMERQQLEASQAVAQAKSEKGLNADLYASFGLTQSAADISGVYRNPQDQQRVQVGFQIPIVDWGLGKGKYKMAESNQEVVRATVQQDEINFEQQILLKVMQFNLQDDQFLIAAKADTVAQLRYNVAKQRFLIGKIDVLDLNVALQEKDEAKRNYISALHNYWSYFYSIQQMTQFDFIKKETLSADFGKLEE
jgi:outer membrane protein TolC